MGSCSTSNVQTELIALYTKLAEQPNANYDLFSNIQIWDYWTATSHATAGVGVGVGVGGQFTLAMLDRYQYLRRFGYFVVV